MNIYYQAANQFMEELIIRLKPIISEAVKNGLESYAPVVNDKSPEDNLMTAKEVMKLLNCSRATLSNWQRDGKIKSLKIGNKVFYKREQILKSLKERSFKSR